MAHPVKFIRRRVIREDYILSAARNQKVLDIGCLAADRLQALHLAIRGVARTVIGMDQHPAEGVIAGDAQNFNLNDTFDLVVAGEIIEHLGDIRGFFSTVARHLPPGGRFILTTPNSYSLLALHRAIRGVAVPNDPYHVTLFDSTTLANMIRGFAPAFGGEIFFYEERRPETLAYRLNRFCSGLNMGWSIGLLANLIKN